MGNVTALVLRELSAIDTDAIQTMKREVGEKRCRSIVDGVIFEITDLLCKIEAAVLNAQPEELGTMVLRLKELANKAGLICVSDIAGDLADCVGSNDPVSTHAVTSRLLRVGEDSLFSLIEFTDRSIV